MSHFVRAGVWLVTGLAGVVVGSLIRPVLAQPAQLTANPIEVGQRMTLSWVERSADCTVQEVRGTFVRCAIPPPDPFSRGARYTTWYNTASVESLSIRQP